MTDTAVHSVCPDKCGKCEELLKWMTQKSFPVQSVVTKKDWKSARRSKISLPLLKGHFIHMN